MLVEDFEGVNKDMANGDTNDGGTWYVDHGMDGDGKLNSSNNNDWTMNEAGIEMRVDGGVNGLNTADYSGNYAEVDAHTAGTNSSITTAVDLKGSEQFELTFNFSPRPDAKDSSDMSFTFGDKTVDIMVDSGGNITFENVPSDVTMTTTSTENGWTTIKAVFDEIDGGVDDKADLNFQATGVADTLGAYIDHIVLKGYEANALDNAIITDSDDTNMESAIITVLNTQANDVLEYELPTGITASTSTDTNGNIVLTLSGTATKADYEEALESITLPANDTTFTEDRQVTLEVFDGDNWSNTVTVDINNDKCEIPPITPPLVPTVQTVTSDTQTESDSLVHTVTMSGESSSDEIYSFSITDDTSDSATDYSASIFSNGVTLNGSTITVPAGVTEFTITTPTTDDTLDENSEVYNLNVGGVAATGTIEDNDTPPEADAVKTRSNLDTDDVALSIFVADSNTPNEADIAFFKTIEIGGGLDGDLSIVENDYTDAADLGGADEETAENNLVFDITTLPNYGNIYAEIDGSYTKIDSSNLDDVSTLLSTANTVSWSATHEEVPSGTEHTIGGVYDSGIAESWNSDDVRVVARSGDNTDATISYSATDGIGVTGNTGGPSSQLGYDADAQASETIIFDFKNPASDADVAITHLIKAEGGGEIGTFEAFLDGKSLGNFTFSNNADTNSDYTLTAEAHGTSNSAGSSSGTLHIDDMVFDQLRFSAQEYFDQNAQVNDSSDYFIGEIQYHDVPNVEFDYQVIDENSNESVDVPVIIEVATDTSIPVETPTQAPTETPTETPEADDAEFDATCDTTAKTVEFSLADKTTDKEDDLDTTDGKVTTIKIDSLAQNGVVTVDGVAIAVGETYADDTNFIYTANSEIDAKTIDGSNVTDSDNGFEVTAFLADGSASTISINDNPYGFGVVGDASGANNEIGYLNETGSEKLVVNFEQDVSSIDVAFAWKHSNNDGETATIEFYKEGVKVGEMIHNGGSDKVDPSVNLKPSNSASFDEVVFGSVGDGDDYLINEIAYTVTDDSFTYSAIDSDDNISNSATVTFDIATQSCVVAPKPTVATLTSDIQEEGTDLVHTVTMSGASTTAETYAFALTDSTAESATDYSTTTFSDSVTYDALTGEITVPAGVTEFSITTPTTDDTLDENSESYDLSVGGVKATGTIEDNDDNAEPISADETQTLDLDAATTTNVTFIVDVSSSMSNNDLDLTKGAIDDIIAQYTAQGGVNINIIQTYGKDTDGNYNHGLEQTGWISDASNVSLITNVSGTDFDQGLKAAVSAHNSAPSANSSAIYFFGDGDTYDSSNANYETDFEAYLPTWNQFITDENIELHTIGVNVSSLSNLDAISASSSIDPIYADNINDLSGIVSDIVVDKSSVTGNVFDNVSGGDGTISIDSINVDGTEYNSNNFPSTGLVTADKGLLEFDFTSGDYTYSASSDKVTSDTLETFKVTASDEDGDTTSFNVNIDVNINATFPTEAPTEIPTDAPTEAPTEIPTEAPTEAPTEIPTDAPTEAPTEIPTDAPTEARREIPIDAPTEIPTDAPTEARREIPTEAPTEIPTEAPTEIPTDTPNDQNITNNKLNNNDAINTGDGEDNITINGDVKDNASINSGSNDDSIAISGKLKGNASITMGDGDDSLSVSDKLQNNVEIDMGTGDDDITLNKINDSYNGKIDMGDGEDTLKLGSNLNLDFSKLDEISNVEKIDMTDGSHDIKLSLDDVLAMTDTDNELTIEGDSEDSLDLDTTGWTKDNTTDNTSTYTKNGSEDSITLTIDDQIDVI